MFFSNILEYIKINNHVIKLVEDLYSFYKPIYSLRSLELEMLKTYTKTNLAISLIKLSKFPADIFILFGNDSLWLYINYQGCNNLTIKN